MVETYGGRCPSPSTWGPPVTAFLSVWRDVVFFATWLRDGTYALGVLISSCQVFGCAVVGRLGPLSPSRPPKVIGVSHGAPSPLLNRFFFRVVRCCPVLFGHALNQRTLLRTCSPSTNRPCPNSCSFDMGVLSSLFCLPSPLVRLN